MLAIFFFCRFAATKIYALGLLGPPIISEHPSSLVARREEPATLNCRASSDSEAGSRLHIQWFKDGQPVSTAPTDPTSHRYIGIETNIESKRGRKRERYIRITEIQA